ncbi:hypothetical protein PAI11_07470 [Patulibacter medicamentivorans]|uniref:Small secreted protein n=1 Tax=Patulibacter medicamentivorans TaxID=1097667 RepID=H0E1T5_9ACTN|nr:hypothetical protein [Patulibacter medicamentivorans]EHN12357.1 hypothetical protein PAI11_07470 [Patulibacter medicamentivorans]
MPDLRTRTASLLVIAVAAAGVTGCGGSDEKKSDGGGSYSQQLNSFCKDANASVSKLQTDLVALQGKFKPSQTKEASKAVEKPLKDYVSASRDQLSELEGLKPPSEYRSFHDKTVKALSAVVDAIDEGTGKLASGDAAGFQKALAGSLQGIGLEKMPASLKKDAPACGTV